jgi:hypothetical protein
MILKIILGTQLHARSSPARGLLLLVSEVTGDRAHIIEGISVPITSGNVSPSMTATYASPFTGRRIPPDQEMECASCGKVLARASACDLWGLLLGKSSILW